MPITYTKVNFDFLRRIPTSNRAALRRALDATALDMQGELKTIVSRPGPPRSKPGEPPRVDTGALRDSIIVRRIGDSVGFLWSDLVEYAPYLEFGTANMAPRPYVARLFHGRGQRQKWQARTAQYPRDELSRSLRPADRRFMRFFGKRR